jgi:hypothetical protein
MAYLHSVIINKNQNMTSVFQWYNRSLTLRPLLTKSCTSLVIMSLGDFLAQTIQIHTGSLKGYDYRRLVVHGAYGALIYAPFVHYYTSRLYPKLNVLGSR